MPQIYPNIGFDPNVLSQGISKGISAAKEGIDEWIKNRREGSMAEEIMHQAYNRGDITQEELIDFQKAPLNKKIGMAFGAQASWQEKWNQLNTQSEIALRNAQIERFQAQAEKEKELAQQGLVYGPNGELFSLDKQGRYHPIGETPEEKTDQAVAEASITGRGDFDPETGGFKYDKPDLKEEKKGKLLQLQSPLNPGKFVYVTPEHYNQYLARYNKRKAMGSDFEPFPLYPIKPTTPGVPGVPGVRGAPPFSLRDWLKMGLTHPDVQSVLAPFRDDL